MIAVWLLLVAITLAEAGLAWVHTAPALMLALLLLLSLAKAALIAWYFMHLKSARPKHLPAFLFTLFACVGLLLAILPEGIRAWSMR
ncbi:MAG: cytochrome C oxidase subunit IV family protein [Bryobacterales bacterium]|nr:cytochrome C oxidase subunit IV family protein [Bryobacterales bacterium]